MGKDGSMLQERRNIAFLSIYVLSMKVHIFSTTFSELMATDTSLVLKKVDALL